MPIIPSIIWNVPHHRVIVCLILFTDHGESELGRIMNNSSLGSRNGREDENTLNNASKLKLLFCCFVVFFSFMMLDLPCVITSSSVIFFSFYYFLSAFLTVLNLFMCEPSSHLWASQFLFELCHRAKLFSLLVKSDRKHTAARAQTRLYLIGLQDIKWGKKKLKWDSVQEGMVSLSLVAHCFVIFHLYSSPESL